MTAQVEDPVASLRELAQDNEAVTARLKRAADFFSHGQKKGSVTDIDQAIEINRRVGHDLKLLRERKEFQDA